MKILIDSHVLIWMLYEPEILSERAKSLLAAGDIVYASTASLWELAIKFGKKRLDYSPNELMQGIDELGLERLPIRDEHIRKLPGIRLPHGDPFDKLLIAQNEAEGCCLMTADALLLGSKYKVINAGS